MRFSFADMGMKGFAFGKAFGCNSDRQIRFRMNGSAFVHTKSGLALVAITTYDTNSERGGRK
jgi:hypothetical protein